MIWTQFASRLVGDSDHFIHMYADNTTSHNDIEISSGMCVTYSFSVFFFLPLLSFFLFSSRNSKISKNLFQKLIWLTFTLIFSFYLLDHRTDKQTNQSTSNISSQCSAESKQAPYQICHTTPRNSRRNWGQHLYRWKSVAVTESRGRRIYPDWWPWRLYGGPKPKAAQKS